MSDSETASNQCNTAALGKVPGIQKVPTPRMELYILRNFLTPEECARFVEKIDADRRPSTIADPNGDNYFRTSETCDMRADDPDVVALDERLSALSGIDLQFGETMQGQRYAVGQEFKAHTDYFEPQGQDFTRYTTVGGQRTWTFMIYLNEPEAGGATRFKTIGKSIQPEIGKLLAWNNRRPDGSCNPATIHHGMKVREGTKYVITKWYREGPGACERHPVPPRSRDAGDRGFHRPRHRHRLCQCRHRLWLCAALGARLRDPRHDHPAKHGRARRHRHRPGAGRGDPGGGGKSCAALDHRGADLRLARHRQFGLSGGQYQWNGGGPEAAGRRHTLPALLALATGLLAAALVVIGKPAWLEKLLIALVLAMSLAFIGGLAVIRVDWGAVLAGLVPRLPADSLFTAIALIGTTVVPYNLFLHAASVRGKFAPDAEGLAASNLDTGLSVTLGGLLSMAIVIMGAATAKLTASGAGPLDDIALRLESLFGMPARIVFALGLVGAGFSSALTAPLATGYVLAEMTGGANDPVRRTRIFRRTALVVIAIGTVFAFFAVNPVELILIAQSANGLLLPILATFLLWVAARRQSLGAFANGPIANLLGGAVVLVCAGLGARLILRSAGIWP